MTTFLQGYRTYILAGLALLVIACDLFGIINVATANEILPILGFGSIISLRAAIN